ncbi:MAG: hypothetical protein NDI69_10355 [Bacteriovoracaceae bacterium]|nr:hypothetical protein [Bacteriovoracaceae bacterium]
MNLISWVLGLSILIYLMLEAVAFHRATVCRQEAWLKSAELKTRSLLPNAKERERSFHLSCRLVLLRDKENITWQKLPGLRKHQFTLKLEGSL